MVCDPLEQLREESAAERWQAWQVLKAKLNASLDDARVDDYAGRVAQPTLAGASESTGLSADRVSTSVGRLAVKYGFEEAAAQARLF